MERRVIRILRDIGVQLSQRRVDIELLVHVNDAAARRCRRRRRRALARRDDALRQRLLLLQRSHAALLAAASHMVLKAGRGALLFARFVLLVRATKIRFAAVEVT